MPYTFVSSPYSHPDEAVMSQRYEDVCSFVAERLRVGRICFSPIVHCHHLAHRFTLPTDSDFWYTYNVAMLRAAHSLTVLQLQGWNESVGVKKELTLAAALNLPIHYARP